VHELRRRNACVVRITTAIEDVEGLRSASPALE
jgi:hypothetical protein